jgi:hypothetical protein
MRGWLIHRSAWKKISRKFAVASLAPIRYLPTLAEWGQARFDGFSAVEPPGTPDCPEWMNSAGERYRRPVNVMEKLHVHHGNGEANRQGRVR